MTRARQKSRPGLFIELDADLPSRKLGWAILFLGALLFAVGLWVVWDALRSPPDAEPFFNLLKGAGCGGAGLGILALEFWPIEQASKQSQARTLTFFFVTIAVMAFVGGFIMRCGMHQIGGYDYSIVVDFGWRLFKGQQPYRDFPCTVPVAFPLGIKFAFDWFGVSWRSIIEMTSLYAMGTFVWSLFLLTRLFGRTWTALFWALTVQLFSMMLASFWWYSPITAVGAVVYMLSAMYWWRRPADNLALASYGASLFLMATLKANDAGIMISGFSLIFLLSRRHRWKVMAISFIAFVCFLAFLSLNHFSFPGLIQAYWGISPRGASLVPFLINLDNDEQRLTMLELAVLLLPALVALAESNKGARAIWRWIPAVVMTCAMAYFAFNTDLIWLAAFAIVVPVLLALLPAAWALRSPGAWIAIVGLLGGIYGCLTNSELKLIDLPPVLIATVLLAGELRGQAPAFRLPVRWLRYFNFVCIVLGCLALVQGYSRARVRSVGMGRYFQFDDTRHTIQSGFFKGVHCSDIFSHVMGDVGRLLTREPASRVYFGTTLEWAYAAFDRPSPVGEPVIWDRLTMFDKSKEDVYYDHLLQSRYDIMVFYHNDINVFMGRERQRLMRQYEMDPSYPYLTILRLKHR